MVIKCSYKLLITPLTDILQFVPTSHKNTSFEFTKVQYYETSCNSTDPLPIRSRMRKCLSSTENLKIAFNHDKLLSIPIYFVKAKPKTNLNAFLLIVTQQMINQPQSHFSTRQPSQNCFSRSMLTPKNFSTSQLFQQASITVWNQCRTNFLRVSLPVIQGLFFTICWQILY